MDKFDKNKRSTIMRSIKQKGTKPEIIIRKSLWSLGYRYRVNYNKLPGKPDIVFLKKKLAIFVNGCFWHGHKDCNKSKLPKTNKKYWKIKIENNMIRDINTYKLLNDIDWKCYVIWQCEIYKCKQDIINKIISYLS